MKIEKQNGNGIGKVSGEPQDVFRANEAGPSTAPSAGKLSSQPKEKNSRREGTKRIIICLRKMNIIILLLVFFNNR